MSDKLTTYMFGRSVRFDGAYTYVFLPGDLEAVFDRFILEWMLWLFPTGRFHVHHDGKGRRYLDFQCEAGRRKRVQVARVILCLLGEREQKNRQARHRDRHWLNFPPENLYLTAAGEVSGDDDTWQEVARREWARENGLEPDGRAPGMLGHGGQPSNKRVSEPATFPPAPLRSALRERMLQGRRPDA
jgi:hypothetical protein